MISRTSPFNGQTVKMNIPVTQKQIDDWKGGTLIQNAMPNLTPDEREFMMTGITPSEWDELFGENGE